MKRLTRALGAVGTLLVSAAALAQAPDPSALGWQGYATWCAACHGDDGRGDGPRARDLPGRPPRDLTQGLYEHRSSLDRVRGEDLVRTILQGLPGTEMPAFRGYLGRDQATAIAEAVLALSPRNTEEPPGEPLEIPPATPDTAEARARGREIYTSDCAGCHGPEGRGDGPRAETLTDARDRPIRPRDLVYEPIEAGRRPEDLYRVVATGMEGVPMTPQAFFLEPEQIWDLVHYLGSIRRDRTAGWRWFRGDPLDPTARKGREETP